jgi:hypothetical protein
MYAFFYKNMRFLRVTCDRCKDSYTVVFFEGIQTLLREEKVTYVIAADRSWLQTSLEKFYGNFTAKEPGKLLGAFFEKTFQLSISLPRLSPDSRQKFWEDLLIFEKKDKSPQEEDVKRIRTEAKREIQEIALTSLRSNNKALQDVICMN